jgi:hypothetical protein
MICLFLFVLHFHGHRSLLLVNMNDESANTCFLMQIKTMIELTRWILSFSLLAGAICHIDLFSIVDALLVLIIPWVSIQSDRVRSRFFIIMAWIALITSSLALIMTCVLEIFVVTNTGKHLLAMQCSLIARILEHIGLFIWTHMNQKLIYILSLIIDVLILGRTI